MLLENELKKMSSKRVASFDVGIKNLAVCVMENDFTILDWDVISLVGDQKKVKGLPLQQLADLLFTTLDDKLKSWGYIDYVVIENQPVMKNPMMKTIQMLIYGFFQSARMACKIGEINLVSAKGKLNVENVVTCTDMKTPYQNAKKTSVLTTRSYLAGKPSLETLEKSKKKDDLCDSFLQGVYFFQKNGLVA